MQQSKQECTNFESGLQKQKLTFRYDFAKQTFVLMKEKDEQEQNEEEQKEFNKSTSESIIDNINEFLFLEKDQAGRKVKMEEQINNPFTSY